MFRSFFVIFGLVIAGVLFPSFTASSISALTPPEVTLAPEGKRLVWEAEWPNRMTGTYELLPGSDCSGQGALWTREGTGRANISPAPDSQNNPLLDLGVADYYVRIPKSGRYRLYMRLWAMDKCGNSCWVAIDDLNPEGMTYFPGGKTGILGSSRHNQWPDHMLQRWIWATDETTAYTLDEGVHHLRIKVREDGFGIDQIALLPTGSELPAGKLAPTQVPGRHGLPDGVEFSTSRTSTPDSTSPTPFDVFFTLKDAVVSGSPPATTGYAWVRLNADAEVSFDLDIKWAGGAVKPGTRHSFALSPSAPLIVIPLTFELPKDAERRSYPVQMSAVGGQWPEFTVTRSQRITHALDWMVTEPLYYSQVSRVLQSFLRHPPGTISELSADHESGTVHWMPVNPDRHYNHFGAVDLEKLHGKTAYKIVIAATWISVEDNWTGSVYASGDDTLRLYAGGKLVLNDYRNCPLTDDIRPWPVQFRKGKQLLVAVVAQQERWWQFQVEFRETGGQPAAKVAGIGWIE